MDVGRPETIRVAFLVEGTRGDIQPYVALALRMQDRGYEVKMFTNVDHGPMCGSFGLAFEGCFYNMEEGMRRPDMMLAMSGGNNFKLQQGLHQMQTESLPVDLPRLWGGLNNFQPAVLIAGRMSKSNGVAYSADQAVPLITLELQPWLPMSDTTLAGLPTLPFGWNGLWFKLMSCGQRKRLSSFREAVRSSINVDLDGKLEVPYMEAYVYDVPSLPCPMFYGYSAHVIPRHPEWPTENLNICGFLTVDREKQEALMNDKTKGAQFGAESGEALSSFLAAGEPPVYMGWGSMLCRSPEWMLEIAVGALQHAQARGVLLGGWAGLGPSGVPAKLQDYCRKNVLFVPSAPHEWLFPQCSVIVHHGGSGTTAASVRSGRPTVVTPLMGDQFDYAAGVGRSGCGVGLAKLGTLTAAGLGDAIAQCLTDQGIIKAAETIGAQLRQEDGSANFIETFEKWVASDHQTGRWLERHVAMMGRCEQAAAKKRGWCGCC